MSMRIRRREEWERVRNRGHGHWILWRGLVGFSLPLTAVVLAYLYAVEMFSPSEAPRPWWVVVLVLIVTSTGAGYAVADWTWHRYEKRFG